MREAGGAGHEARGAITPGTTLLDALRYEHPGPVDDLADAGPGKSIDVGVLVVAEEPYAEGMGDRFDLALPVDTVMFDRMRSICHRLVMVIYSGRPMVHPALAVRADAIVAAWLPGTEGGGLADVLLERRPFGGRLSPPWPAHLTDVDDLSATPLYPSGTAPVSEAGNRTRLSAVAVLPGGGELNRE